MEVLWVYLFIALVCFIYLMASSLWRKKDDEKFLESMLADLCQTEGLLILLFVVAVLSLLWFVVLILREYTRIRA